MSCNATSLDHEPSIRKLMNWFSLYGGEHRSMWWHGIGQRSVRAQRFQFVSKVCVDSFLRLGYMVYDIFGVYLILQFLMIQVAKSAQSGASFWHGILIQAQRPAALQWKSANFQPSVHDQCAAGDSVLSAKKKINLSTIRCDNYWVSTLKYSSKLIRYTFQKQRMLYFQVKISS